MIRFARTFATLALGAAVIFAYGCGSSSGGSGSSGEGNSSSGDGGSSGSGDSCSATCSSGSDCENIVCSCKDGTDVNTTACDNGCCADAASACPDSCSDDGGWGG